MPSTRRCCHLIIALFLAGLCIALFTGCSDQERGQAQNVQLLTEVRDLEAQVSEMEEEIQALRQDVANLAMRHEQDIEALRSDLKNVLEYLNIALDRLTRNEDLEKNLDDLGKSATRAFKESLQQLLDMSKEMLERLEKEIQDRETESNQGQP